MPARRRDGLAAIGAQRDDGQAEVRARQWGVLYELVGDVMRSAGRAAAAGPGGRSP